MTHTHFSHECASNVSLVEEDGSATAIALTPTGVKGIYAYLKHTLDDQHAIKDRSAVSDRANMLAYTHTLKCGSAHVCTHATFALEHKHPRMTTFRCAVP